MTRILPSSRRPSPLLLPGDPHFSKVALLLPMNGSNNSTTFTDRSANAWTVTASGNAKISTDQSVYGGSSAAFDGAGDLLTIAANSVFDFSTTPNTFECWLYVNAFPSVGNFCRAWMFGANGETKAFIPLQFDANGTVVAAVPGAGYTALTSTSTLSLNTWTRYRLVQNGSSSKMFFGSTQVASGTLTAPTSGSNNMRVGYDTVTTVNFNFNGYFGPMRVTKGLDRSSSDPNVINAPFPVTAG